MQFFKTWLPACFLPIALFLLLTFIYVAPFGTRTLIWEAGRASRLIGRPLPDARTEMCAYDDCVRVLNEPLYMSIIPPAGLWHEMRIEVAYDLRDQTTFELGLVQDFTTQSFTLLPLDLQESTNGLTVGAATFPLENVQKENGAYKMILSLPGVADVAEKPMLHRIQVTFVRHTSVMGEVKWFVKGLWKRRL